MIAHIEHKLISVAAGVLITILLLFLLAGCGQPTPTPFPTHTVVPTPTASATPAPTNTPTPIPLETYEIEAGFFAIDLPTSWQVEEQGLTSLGRYYRIGPPPLGPGPATSSLFIASGEATTAIQAAEQLLCGNGCAGDIELESVTLGGEPAQRTVIPTDGDQSLEWFFLEHLDQLLVFSLHDPDTLVTRQDLLDTLALIEPTPAPTPTATATMTPVPSYEIEAVSEWRAVASDEAGLRFTVPAGWEGSGEWQWTPREAPALSLGFLWDSGRDLSPTDLLPDAPEEGQILAQSEYRPGWQVAITDTEGISATISVESGVQQHIIVRVGLRVYDFYSAGPAPQALAALKPVLEEVVESVEITDLLFFIDDPTEAAVGWFDAMLQDPSGESALPYMTGELQEQIPEEGTPLALLGLPDRLLTYNLAWLNAGANTMIYEATITLQNEETVTRTVTLLEDDLVGWRVASIEATPDGE